MARRRKTRSTRQAHRCSRCSPFPRLSPRRAGRLADPGQSRLARARQRHHRLSRRQWRPCRPHPAGPRRGLDWAAAGAAIAIWPTCRAAAHWIAFGAGERRVYLETPTWADLTPRTAVGRADRGRAGDACRIDRRPGLRGARNPPHARRNIAGCGPAIRAEFVLDRAAGRTASTIPATASTTPSTKASAGPARVEPATSGSPAGCAWPGSRRRCGRHSPQGLVRYCARVSRSAPI